MVAETLIPRFLIDALHDLSLYILPSLAIKMTMINRYKSIGHTNTPFHQEHPHDLDQGQHCHVITMIIITTIMIIVLMIR